MARARSRQRLCPVGMPLGVQDPGEVAQVGGDFWVVGAVGGLVNGQGAFEERLRLVGMPLDAQGRGEVAQGGGDFGVVGAVDGFVDGQGAVEEGDRVVQPRVYVQVGRGPVQQPRGILQQAGVGGRVPVQVAEGG